MDGLEIRCYLPSAVQDYSTGSKYVKREQKNCQFFCSRLRYLCLEDWASMRRGSRRYLMVNFVGATTTRASGL